MHKIILAEILFVTIVLESTIAMLPLTLILIVYLSIVWEERSVIWAFAAGLILDIFLMRPLGIDSFIFLLIILLGFRYRLKFDPRKRIYQLVYFGLAVVLYTAYFYRGINLLLLLFSLGLAACLDIMVKKWFPYLYERGKLRV